MKKIFRCGLVVGKFSPLHRGHELLIRRAFEACEEVVVISYSKPEFPGCEAERRDYWLAELFPEARRLVVTDGRLRGWLPDDSGTLEVPLNDADETTHRRFVGFLCRQVLGVIVDAVFTSEDYGQGFAEELTEYFRRDNPAAPVVRSVLVDRERREIPVSGAMIRADVHAHQNWLSPAVYASFVRRVCVLGGESSGKSTLTEALARHFGTVYVPEYGRDLWEAKRGALTLEDMRHIAERQVMLEEEAVRRAKQFLFCDTSPLTTLFYSRHGFNWADPKLEQLAERSYDLVVLCPPEFPFVQDGTRQDAAFRQRQHAWYMQELARRGVACLLVRGEVEERVAKVSEAVMHLR